MVEQQLDGEVRPQLLLEDGALQHTVQRGGATVVHGVDVGPAQQEEAYQGGVGGPACLVQGAPPRLIPGIDVSAVGSQQPAKLQAVLAGALHLPAEDAEGRLLPCAPCVDARSVL